MNRFEPWIGVEYAAGLAGVRILILGESHWGEPSWQYSEFTRDVVKKWCFEKRDRFFTSIAKLVLGLPPGTYLPDGERAAFWQHVAFYNYVPVIVGPGPRARPIEEHWALAGAPFRDVLAELCPHVVIALGKELWWHLPPPDSVEHLASSLEVIEVYRYATGTGVYSDAIMIQHPSSFRMRYGDWRPRIEAFMAEKRHYVDATPENRFIQLPHNPRLQQPSP